MQPYTFANILFSSPCNLHCPYCIGHNQTLQAMPDNLHTFPLKGLDRFVEQLREHGITQISLTGTNTEPQLYAYESELRSILRANSGVKISLHTNGLLVLRKIEVFNQYDRAAISFPSFQPDTYHKLTGHPQVLDLAAIVKASRIPIKVSTILTEQNIHEIPEIIARCRNLGISASCCASCMARRSIGRSFRITNQRVVLAGTRYMSLTAWRSQSGILRAPACAV